MGGKMAEIRIPDSEKIISETYQCAPHIKWAVDTQGIMLMNQDTAEVHRLANPQAAVWDLITREYPYPKTVGMLAAIAALDETAAEHLLMESLQAWTEAGILILKRRHG
jgi:hypothetical protein